jgi:hypothetical protein
MLGPMQPRAGRVRLPIDPRSLLAAHLDLIMLAFMEFGAAFVLSRWALRAAHLLAWLLIFGGLTNPLLYFLRGAGINAFVLGDGPKQRVSARLAGISSASILVAWSIVARSL